MLINSEGLDINRRPDGVLKFKLDGAHAVANVDCVPFTPQGTTTHTPDDTNNYIFYANL
jgi:hypothetical protein